LSLWELLALTDALSICSQTNITALTATGGNANITALTATGGNANITALTATGGNVDAAVDRLLSGMQGRVRAGSWELLAPAAGH
ncbi:hypothetical protein T484DRAFT_1827729, partial [Baffinella frigidus]